MCISIHNCYANIRSWAHQDKQGFSSRVPIKLMQKKMDEDSTRTKKTTFTGVTYFTSTKPQCRHTLWAWLVSEGGEGLCRSARFRL